MSIRKPRITTSALRERLLYVFAVVYPMNGVQIWIGRNWTPFQIVTIIYFFVVLLSFLLNYRKEKIWLSRKYFIILLIVIVANGLSILYKPSINSVLYFSESFNESSYNKISLWYFLWLIQNIFTVIFLYNEISTPIRLNKFLRITIKSSAFYALYGLYQFIITFLLGENSKFFVYILKPEYLWGPEAIRIASLDREPLYYAFYLNFILLLIISQLRYKSYILPKKKLIAIFCINFIVFVLSRATMGFIAFALTLIIFYFRQLELKKVLASTNRFLKTVGFLGLSIVLGLIFYLGNQHRIGRRLSSISEMNTDYERIKSILGGLNTFFENRYLGVGLGNSPFFIKTEVVHNMYIQVLAETGIIGFMSILIWIIFHFRASKRIHSNVLSLTFYLVMIAVCIQWMSFYNFNLPIVWVFSGLMMAILKLQRNTDNLITV